MKIISTLKSKKNVVEVKQRKEWWKIWVERKEKSNFIYSLDKCGWSLLDLFSILHAT